MFIMYLLRKHFHSIRAGKMSMLKMQNKGENKFGILKKKHMHILKYKQEF